LKYFVCALTDNHCAVLESARTDATTCTEAPAGQSEAGIGKTASVLVKI